ncbi:MAG: hypothetical protein V3V96_14395 [Acidiferrobacterales bacterium]
MPSAYVKKPVPTAAMFVECIKNNDLGDPVGKRTLWSLVTRLSPALKREFEVWRDEYRKGRFSITHANTLAALDLAATLPSSGELPVGFLDSLRPDGAETSVVRIQEAAEEADVSSLRGNRLKTKQAAFERLLAQVQDCSQGNRSGIGSVVSWVSANLSVPVAQLVAEEVPGPEALSLYRWARENETEYRRLYDSKRIPSRGLAEDREAGLIDGGELMDDIMGRLVEGLRKKTGDSDVSMRHMQATGSGGDGSGSSGGVHGLPGGDVERGGSSDSGEG